MSHFFFFFFLKKRVVSLALLRKSFSLDPIRRFQNSSPEKPQSPRLHVGWQQQPYLQCINVKSGPSCTALFDVCFPQINQLHPPLPLSIPPPPLTSERTNNAAEKNKVSSSVRGGRCPAASLISYCRAAAFHCAFNTVISRTGFPQLVEIHKTLSQQFFFPFSLFMAPHPLKMTTEEVDRFPAQLNLYGISCPEM